MITEPIAERNEGDDVVMLSPRGKLQATIAQQLRASIASAQSENRRYVILDLSGVDFISSAGVGVIYHGMANARRLGGNLILCNTTDKIRYVLDELGVADYLTITSDEKEALAVCGVGQSR
jgi:anti-anti-sigma factor